jgi:hypothetical protein
VCLLDPDYSFRHVDDARGYGLTYKIFSPVDDVRILGPLFLGAPILLSALQENSSEFKLQFVFRLKA